VTSATPASAAPVERTLPPLSFNAWLRYDLARRMLPAGPGDLLDVGCGQAALGIRLAARAGYRYVGVEPDEASYRIAAQRLAAAGIEGEIRHGDLTALKSTDSFDVVSAFEVLEHIEDDKAALDEWTRRIRPGGTLLISTPAHQRRYGVQDELVGHYRRYDPPAMEELLKAAGLTRVEVRLYGMPAGYALEAARNAVGRRRIAAVKNSPLIERSQGSGRFMQPSSSAAGLVTRFGTAPFRQIQRAFPHTGPTLVARGTVKQGTVERGTVER
jgi:SAM-dependent methyltransferase